MPLGFVNYGILLRIGIDLRRLTDDNGNDNELRMLFTPETARKASANAAIARQSNRNSELAKLALAEQIIAKASETGVISNGEPTKQDEFIQRRIARTRMQIDRICALIDEEEDAQALDRLAAALHKLSTLEREYAMRPAPGTLRPDKPKSKPTQLPPAPDTP